ncbi:MAG: NAD-dependent succinate-semialdehyde dehydrogenase, partial [Zoogloea oleivorans]|uniref:NAD-dependent succinate-semialdehyde dehydrogenase n=1 Tax=Zoogloea oleivorans TaxID=1552750 RepID=UPI002A360BE1
AETGAVCEVINPADGSILGHLPVAGAPELDRAIAAAEKGLRIWRCTPPARRTEVLLKAAVLLRERIELIAPLSTLEVGQPIGDARNYLLRGAEIIDWDANEGRRVYGRIIPSEPGLRQMVVHEPVGVVAALTPWNAPIFTPCRKIASALAAGCSLILKAAEEAPAATMALVQCFIDAGVPPGVLNLVYGDPAMISRYLIEAPAVRLISFTGSVPVGKYLAQLAAQQMKPTIMELGGHAPVIVCADADVQGAAEKIAAAKYRNAGQACIAPSRFYVHESVYASFVERFVAAAEKIKVGPGFEAGVGMGPLANIRRLAAVESLVDDALKRGARAASGGKRLPGPGFFFPPTVLVDVPGDARILSEEPFGPVVTIAPFRELDDAIAQANALPYGLAGYAFTRSAATADKIATELECGAIAINHLTVSTHGIPFGGVKESGIGREGGTEGVAGYTISKTVTHLMT